MKINRAHRRVAHQVFTNVEALFFRFMWRDMDYSVPAKLSGTAVADVKVLVRSGVLLGCRWQVRERVVRHFSDAGKAWKSN